MRGIDTIGLVGIVLLTFAVAYAIVLGWAETGPNCPGMNPEWLGYCVEVTK